MTTSERTGFEVWDTPHPYDDVSTYADFVGNPRHQREVCSFMKSMLWQFYSIATVNVPPNLRVSFFELERKL